MITMVKPKHSSRCCEGLKYNATYASKRLNYLLLTNEGRTQRALGGTQNANQEWRVASFVKTYNALKVMMVMVVVMVVMVLVVVLVNMVDDDIVNGGCEDGCYVGYHTGGIAWNILA